MVEMSNVVTKLAKLTEKGQIPWKTTADDSTFAATFGKLSVLISLQLSTEGNRRGGEYKLAVLDEKGNEIDFAVYRPDPFVFVHDELELLYKNAKRSALGVDERLEELMKAMDLIAES